MPNFSACRFRCSTQVEVIRLIAEQGGAPYRYVVTPNAYHVVTVHDAPDAAVTDLSIGAWLSLCDSRIVRGAGAVRPAAAAARDRQRSSRSAAGGAERIGERARAAAHSRRRPAARDRTGAARGPIRKLDIDIMPAPNCAGAKRGAAACRGACLRRPELGHSAAVRRLPGAGADRDGARGLGCKSGIALCVGASIDFVTGTSVRAPLLAAARSDWNGLTG